MNALAEMRSRQHRIQRRLDRTRRIGQEVRNAGERLVGFRVQDMQNRANKQGVTGLLPMIAALERAFGIDEDVGDILSVADLTVTFADLEERIIGCARLIGRVEQEYRSKSSAPTGGQPEVLALDVMDDRGAPPGQQGRNDQTDALARTGWGKAKDMLGTVVPDIAAIKAAEDHSLSPEKSGAPNLPCIGPARRAVGCHLLGFLRPPHRQHDGNADSGKPAARRDAGAFDKYFWRVGVELKPPDEECKRLIHRPAPNREPGRPELWLEGETPGRPLRRAPKKREHHD